MKKIYTLIILSSMLTSLNLTAQVPNSGFENWIPDVNGIPYPTGWITTNSSPDTTIEQYTPAYQGNYSMKVKVVDLGGFILGGIAQLDFPYSQRPTHLNASVLSSLMPGDTAYIIVSLRQGDSIIASPMACTFHIDSTMSQWTNLSFPISYWSSLNPDTASIIVIAGFPNHVQLGTYLVVDELSFSFTSGINETENSSPAILGQNFPNPVSSSTVFPLTIKKGSEITLHLYDVLGNEVKTISYGLLYPGENTLEISVTDLPDGIYHYSVKGNDFVNSGKLIVKK